MRTHGLWMIPVVAALSGACKESPAIDPNSPPTAVAWLDHADHAIPEDDRGAVDEIQRKMGVVLPYAGSDVTVTLDGTRSSDRDGDVASYTWLSANFGPDCMGRDPDSTHDPKDVAKPEVTLGEGFWEFGLWVTDDDGSVSDQSVVTIRIGDSIVDPCPDGPGSGAGGGTGGTGGGTGDDAGAVDPMQQCVLDCAATMCPTEAMACDANPDCWPLVDCMATNCAGIDYTDMTMVTNCFVANCAAFIGGVAESTAIGPCARQCNTDCMGM